jgi:hypothetical protein
MNDSDIQLTIPVALTVSQIARANPTIGDDEARELAQQLHSIIDAVQAAYATHPPDKAMLTMRLPGVARCLPYEAAVAYELGDVIDSVRNTNFGFWLGDEAELSVWIMERLTDLDGSGFLYDRYLLLYDRVQGTDFAGDVTMKEDGAVLQ